MSAALAPVELFSLAVDPEDDLVPALVGNGEQATFRLTMAAIDPTQAVDPKSADGGFTGAVLKIVRVPFDDDDEEDSDEEESMDLADMLDQDDSDEDEEEDEDVNGAPSDPAKSPKAKRMAALKQALAEAQAEDEMEVDGETSAKSKGKARATDEDDDEDDEDEDESDFEGSDVEGAEEFVLCTLDPAKAYQQTLDITVSEYEVVYFKVSGTHTVYLTGNILVPIGPDSDDDYDSEDEEDDYDMLEGDDMEDYLSDEDEDESDELDDMEDPRITEVDDEEEAEAPKLVKQKTGKGKNKRPAEDSSDVEPVKSAKDEVALKVDGEEKLSKNQLKKMKKKMKDNEGNAVDTSAAEKGDKKVQFAKELVQGPTGSAKTNGEASPKVNGDAAKPKAAKGVKVVQGVTIDDKTVGSGPGAKKGDKVSMRYIGKLDKDKKIFDSNKKGAPFRFTLGTGEVIKGWDIGMQGIQVGGERRITVPAHHAYGSKKMDGIPANSTLVFDVKCVDIK